jgi:hypothetical protein
MHLRGLAWMFLLLLAGLSPAQTAEKINLRLLYVGDPTSARGQTYAEFLRQHFRHADAAQRKGFDPRRASAFDVVLLDWSQTERPDKPMSPLGPKQSWEKPTVLLGSAGLLLAEAWEIHGTIG